MKPHYLYLLFPLALLLSLGGFAALFFGAITTAVALTLGATASLALAFLLLAIFFE